MDHSNAYGCQWVDARVSSRVILRVSTAYQVSDSAAATLVFDCSFVVAIFFYMGTRYAILKRFLFFFRSEICNSSCSRSPSLAMTGSAVYSRLYAGFLRKRAEFTLPLRRYLISEWGRLWWEEHSNTMAYSMTTEYNTYCERHSECMWDNVDAVLKFAVDNYIIEH